jgi:phosphoribosylformylglycinamidine (FGAM) synthase-like amidotransferase family enzyme
VLAVGFDQIGAASIVLAVLAVFATLESVFGICVGCKVFALLMKAGVIPAEVCESCNNITLRAPAAAAGPR